MFKRSAGIDLLHVPYAGSGPARAALLAGDTPLCAAAYSSFAGLIASGEAIPLATTARRRLPQVPQMPTMAELGYPEATLNIWMGLFAPLGTPDAIVQAFVEAIATMAHDPKLAAQLAKASMLVDYTDPAETKAIMQREFNMTRDLAQLVNLRS